MLGVHNNFYIFSPVVSKGKARISAQLFAAHKKNIIDKTVKPSFKVGKGLKII